jgi:hypothetical protein
MKISKNSPASSGHLACLINATIEVLGLDITKMEGAPSFGAQNQKLSLLGKDYKSTFKLHEQWTQFFDILDQLISEDSQKDDIEKLADEYFENLQRNHHL